jgi:hypothetical protein
MYSYQRPKIHSPEDFIGESLGSGQDLCNTDSYSDPNLQYHTRVDFLCKYKICFREYHGRYITYRDEKSCEG